MAKAERNGFPYPRFHSSRAAKQGHTWSMMPVGGLINTVIDLLIVLCVREDDSARRRTEYISALPPETISTGSSIQHIYLLYDGLYFFA